MQSSFDGSLSAVLKHEGGFANNPKDNGGPTNKGVTLATFRRFVKPGGTIADLKALTTAQASVVYQRQYWDTVLGAQLPAGVDYATFDMSVHSGPKLAVKFLQRAVGAKADGAVGPKTLAAVAAKPAAEIIGAMIDARMAFLKRHEDWPTFGKGWTSRIAGVRKLALQMAAAPAHPVEVTEEPPAAPEAPLTPPPPATCIRLSPAKIAGWLAALAIAGWAAFNLLT